MNKVLLALGVLPPVEMAVLEDHFEVIRLRRNEEPEAVLQERRMDISAILASPWTPVRRHLIEALPNLEIIAHFGVGYDSIDIEACIERKIQVTNTPDVVTDDTADIGMGLILACARKIVESDVFIRVGNWRSGHTPMGTSLKGKTLGILGLGQVGRALARRAEAFEMSVIYHNRRPVTGPDNGIEYPYAESLTDLARDADFLALCVPGNDDTRHMVSADILEQLGEKGYLINIARGSVINEADLVEALLNKKIAGAGLDVFEHEPNVPEALLAMDNVVLLPHMGAATHETRSVMGEVVIANLLAYFSGKELVTPVLS